MIYHVTKVNKTQPEENEALEDRGVPKIDESKHRPEAPGDEKYRVKGLHKSLSLVLIKEDGVLLLELLFVELSKISVDSNCS